MYYYSWCRFGSSHIPTITASCLLRKHNYAGLTDEGWEHGANNTRLKYHRFSITTGTELLSSQHHLQPARQRAACHRCGFLPGFPSQLLHHPHP